MSNNEHEIVPAGLAITAMRDNGYRNTAYAVAELIDNSIQAGANSIELICLEDQNVEGTKNLRQLRQVGVLDNGKGMSAETLQKSLQFGNGSNLGATRGIGKFGMGLPASSISQCKRVDVWSWQNGIENAISTYLDIDKIKLGDSMVPVPQRSPIAEEWIRAAGTVGSSGTLVVWSNLDRVLWKRGVTLLRNSEFSISRMYRKFLASGEINIRLAAFDVSNNLEVLSDEPARPNDPGYLIVPSSTPAPYDAKALFQEYPDASSCEDRRTIEHRGQEFSITVRYSLLRKDAREGLTGQPGSTSWGKHAGKNVGISVVRAGRELNLEQGLVIGYDPRERFWGVEVEFDPGLDEIFGVTSNKQEARHFSEVIAKWTHGEAPEQMSGAEEDSEGQAILIKLVKDIEIQLRAMRATLKAQVKEKRTPSEEDRGPSPEDEATEKTRERQEGGHAGQSDAQEAADSEQQADAIAIDITDEENADPREAGVEAEVLLNQTSKYFFRSADLDGKTFFQVKPRGGKILIRVNINHPAFQHLFSVLDADDDAFIENLSLEERLDRADRGLKLLLLAWARFEDEQLTDDRRALVQEVRGGWGRIAWDFLEA